MQHLAWCAGVLVITACTSAPPDASPGDTSNVDANLVDANAAPADAGPTLRLDVATCAGLVDSNASVIACDETDFRGPACDRLLDVPSFTASVDGSVCDMAAASADSTATVRFDLGIEFTNVSCAGMTLTAAGVTVRVSFGDVRQAAHLVANASVSAIVLAARVEAGECARTLILEGASDGVFELHDVAGTGGTIVSRWVDGLHLSPLGGPAASCPALDRLCMTSEPGTRAFGPFALALDACGGAGLPIGGCGDPFGAGFAGAASCGGRIHFAIFPTPYVRICH